MPDEIALVRKGRSPTLLHADKANEVIKAVNALLNMQVESGDSTQVINSGDQITLSIQAGSPSGYSGTIHFVTEDLDTGAIIPHTFIFENGILVQYDESI